LVATIGISRSGPSSTVTSKTMFDVLVGGQVAVSVMVEVPVI
jgi:hypothetical protein